MRRCPSRTRIRLILLAALAALLLPAAGGGCIAGTCEDNCLDQYDDCLARSPPGASKADCAAAYDNCLAYCTSTESAPEQAVSK